VGHSNSNTALELEHPRSFWNGPSSEKEIEIAIERAPRTEPLSKASYQLPLSELKEMMVQMLELLNKEFIHTSTSLWGTPVLLVKEKDGSLQFCIDYRQLN